MGPGGGLRAWPAEAAGASGGALRVMQVSLDVSLGE